MDDQSVRVGDVRTISSGNFKGRRAKVVHIEVEDEDGDPYVECEVDGLGRPVTVPAIEFLPRPLPIAMSDELMRELEAEVTAAARERAPHALRRMPWLHANAKREDLDAVTDEYAALEDEIDAANDALAHEAVERFRAAIAPHPPEERIAIWKELRDELLLTYDAPAWDAFYRTLGGEDRDRTAIDAAVGVARAFYQRLVAARRDPSRWKDDLDGTEPIARNPELEAAIERSPDDEAAYLVYADYLQSKGDPRGELIVHERRGLLFRHERYLLGGLARYEDDECMSFEWRHGFLRSAKVQLLRKHEDEGLAQAPLVKTLMALPSSRFLETLILGCPSVHEDGVAEAMIAALVEAGPRPTLRRLVFTGDLEEEMLSWLLPGDLGPLWKLYPGLTSLEIVAGAYKLGAIDLPSLQDLRIQTCFTSRSNVQGIVQGKLPSLQRFELWFGDSQEESSATIDDIEPLLASLKGVTHLGLVNTEFTNAICERLVRSPIFARLERLDLSRGTLTDEGAHLLAEHRDLAPRLVELDVRENYLSDDGIEALSGYPNVSADEQREAEEYDGEVHRYCAVAE